MNDYRIITMYSPKYGMREAFVDAEKYDLPMRVDTAWGVHGNKHTETFYVRRNIIGPHQRYKGEKQMLHHLVFVHPPQGLVVDFINHNGLDCRLENLRLATPKQDQGNRLKIWSSTSPYKGVTFNQKKKVWQARLLMNGVRTNLGSFKTAEEAARAYNAAAQDYFGEFALLNEVA